MLNGFFSRNCISGYKNKILCYLKYLFMLYVTSAHFFTGICFFYNTDLFKNRHFKYERSDL